MARSSLSPGFRFHPTDVELVMYYLKRKLLGKKPIVEAVAEVNIYNFSPWDLPDMSNLRSGDLEWFFFCPKARKYSSGSRSNRATETGFWKATGKDRQVEYKQRTVAMIKTLVFHQGHAPNGQRTDWVMHEYRMEDKDLLNKGVVQDAYVLCKIFKKSGAGPKNGAQYGAPFNEDEWNDDQRLAVVVGPDGATGPEPKSACSGLLTEPDGSTGLEPGCAYSVPLTEPGSSTVTTSLNERNVDSAAFTTEEIALIMDENGDNKDKGVEDGKEKKVEGGEDDGFYDELVSIISLEMDGGVAGNESKFNYTLDDDDDDDDDVDAFLTEFYVD